MSQHPLIERPWADYSDDEVEEDCPPCVVKSMPVLPPTMPRRLLIPTFTTLPPLNNCRYWIFSSSWASIDDFIFVCGAETLLEVTDWERTRTGPFHAYQTATKAIWWRAKPEDLTLSTAPLRELPTAAKECYHRLLVKASQTYGLDTSSLYAAPSSSSRPPPSTQATRQNNKGNSNCHSWRAYNATVL